MGNKISINKDNNANKWSNLLPDLLHLIASQFDDHKDLLTFRSVCKLWRSVAMADARLTPFPPLFLIPYDKSNDARTFFDPSSRKELTVHIPKSVGKFIFATAHGYLLLASQKDNDNDDGELSLSLFNPITRSQIHLPDLRPQDGSRHCRHSCVEDFRVVLSSHPLSDPAPILAVWANKTLFFLTLGDADWREVELKFRYFSYENVFAYCHDCFFLVNGGCFLSSLVIDAQSLESYKMDVPIEEDMLGIPSFHMIVFSGDLFLVVSTDSFSVIYKPVKENGGRWRWSKEDYNKSSDLVFFQSNYLSVAVASPDVIGCKPNYIYCGWEMFRITDHGDVKIPMVWTEKFDLPGSMITEEHVKIDCNLWFHNFYEEIEPPDDNGYTWFIPDPH